MTKHLCNEGTVVVETVELARLSSHFAEIRPHSAAGINLQLRWDQNQIWGLGRPKGRNRSFLQVSFNSLRSSLCVHHFHILCHTENTFIIHRCRKWILKVEFLLQRGGEPPPTATCPLSVSLNAALLVAQWWCWLWALANGHEQGIRFSN